MKTPPTITIIAIVCIALSFAMFAAVLLGFAKCSAEAQGQLIQVPSSVILIVIGYYFGATHNQKKQINEG